MWLMKDPGVLLRIDTNKNGKTVRHCHSSASGSTGVNRISLRQRPCAYLARYHLANRGSIRAFAMGTLERAIWTPSNPSHFESLFCHLYGRLCAQHKYRNAHRDAILNGWVCRSNGARQWHCRRSVSQRTTGQRAFFTELVRLSGTCYRAHRW